MTGYGRVVKSLEQQSMVVELKSLNSRYLDIKIKLPNRYRSLEVDLRKQIGQAVERGKVECTIDLNDSYGDEEYVINESLFGQYAQSLQRLQSELSLPEGDLLYTISRMPNAVTAKSSEPTEAERQAVEATVAEAIEAFMNYRRTEGEVTGADFRKRVELIAQFLKEVEPHEGPRIQKVRDRIQQHLDEWLDSDKVDPNRFEQEMVYYLEKYDISEEKLRLQQHCDYFLETLANSRTAKGKKLNFIVQEMGREINTIGSKANSIEIQRLVVQMKDELEKIKEQIANIL